MPAPTIPNLRTGAILLTLLAACAFAIGGFRPGPARAAEVVIVDVVDFAFSPATITIQVGDTIQWNNADAVDHTATSVDGAPAAFDVYLSAGAWGSHTFEVAGTYHYYCIPHPTMTGRIIVEPAPVATAPPPASAGGGSDVPDVAMSAPAPGSAATLGIAFVLLSCLLAILAIPGRASRDL